MFRLKFLPAGLLLSALLASSLAHAQVDAAQAARLGQDLTPIGGEKAGNAEGTIPAWDGGLARRDDAYDPVVGYKDPFAEDKPLFTISAANAGEYADKLSPGQLAMLKRYPNTWKLPVYPTRRSASYPQHVYEAVKRNALNAKLMQELAASFGESQNPRNSSFAGKAKRFWADILGSQDADGSKENAV